MHVATGKFSPNTAVQFVLPATVPAGERTMRLATQTSGGKKDVFVKEVRSFTYATPVLVV